MTALGPFDLTYLSPALLPLENLASSLATVSPPTATGTPDGKWASEILLATHDNDEQNAELARGLWDENGLDVPGVSEVSGDAWFQALGAYLCEHLPPIL